MSALRLLNVIRSLDPAQGGPAEGLRQSIGATALQGHLEEVLTLDAPDAPWLPAFPARVHAIGPARGHYGYTGALVPWLRQYATVYDAVIVHGIWQYHSLGTWRALQGGRVPYFLYFHGMMDPWFRERYPLKHLKKRLYWPWADYRVARDAAAVLFTAEDERLRAAQSFGRYRVRPAVVGYGLSLPPQVDQGEAAAFRAAFPAVQGRQLLLFLGRLHEKKGVDLLIEAFARQAAQQPDLHLVMAGPDQQGLQVRLQARAQALGVAHRITWTGMLQGPLKWGALHAADAFILPSHQENFGIAVVEALAAGLPVLISDRVNIWREITTAGAGLAAPDTLAGTLDLLVRFHALGDAGRQQMREAARQAYDQHFRMEAASTRLIETIRPHLRRTPTGRSTAPDARPGLGETTLG